MEGEELERGWLLGCSPHDRAAHEWLKNASALKTYFFYLRVSKQLSYTWIIFPTFCSQL